VGELEIRYSTYDKAQPPRLVRLKNPGWGGQAQKMVDGSEPQPWHCLPFTEGSTYGLELVYQYERECHVINDGGMVRFEWDYASEPDCKLQGSEFITFFPKEASRYYAFNTGVDIKPPSGYVICTLPHPRFFTDATGTVPISMIGHVQSEWWPKKFFVVFKAPLPGERHIFRKGEPYVQLRFEPRRATYQITKMDQQEEAARRNQEQSVVVSSLDIARNVWRNPAGYAFNDHYKMLARAFERGGTEGVEEAIETARARRDDWLPRDKPIAECLELGRQRELERKYRDAFAIYNLVLSRDPHNAEAANRMGIIAASTEKMVLAMELMSRAVALAPGSAKYQSDMGELLRRLGRLQEAEAALRASLQINAVDPQVLSNLGLTLSQQGRVAEGIAACRSALTIESRSAIAHFRMGLILSEQRQYAGARAYFETTLALAPNFQEARQRLDDLPATA
jgi:tetratricopeptide (TPR) repeat protein